MLWRVPAGPWGQALPHRLPCPGLVHSGSPHAVLLRIQNPSKLLIPEEVPVQDSLRGQASPGHGSSWLLSLSLVPGSSGCAEFSRGPASFSPQEDWKEQSAHSSRMVVGPRERPVTAFHRSPESVGTSELRQPLHRPSPCSQDTA